MQVLLELGMVSEQWGGRRKRELIAVSALSQKRFKVVNPPNFFQLNLFKVVGIDVVPELSQEHLVGVVVSIGLLVRHFEVEPTLEP